MVLVDGTAMSYIESLPEEKTKNCYSLCLAMDERFGDSLFTEVYWAELKMRTGKRVNPSSA